MADEMELMSVAFAAYRLAMNNTPFCAAMWRRMESPQPGELVMEISRAARAGVVDGFGELVSYDRDEATGEIRRPDGVLMHWENATFVAVPTRKMVLEVERELERQVAGSAESK